MDGLVVNLATALLSSPDSNPCMSVAGISTFHRGKFAREETTAVVIKNAVPSVVVNKGSASQPQFTNRIVEST